MIWYRLYQFTAAVVYYLRLPDSIAVPVLDWLERRVPWDC
jgi:hypothetical protein